MHRFNRLLGVPAAVFALVAATSVSAQAANINRPAGCPWQPLALVNGWQSEQATYDTGNPVYCVENGAVFLGGSLTQPGGGSSEFAVLPASARPASTVYLNVYADGGSGAVLRIEPDGEMAAYPGVNSTASQVNVTDFTSLAGISFTQASTTTQPLALEYNSKSAGPTYGTGDPAYYLAGGIVHLSGSMLSTDPATVARTPATAEPGPCVETSVYAYGGSPADLTVDPQAGYMSAVDETGDGDGQVEAEFTSLDGVSYPAAGAQWTPLSLPGNWGQDDVNCYDGPPSYYVSGGVVYLDGSLLQSTPGSSCAFAVLPPIARPAHTLYLMLGTEGLRPAYLRINPDGTTCVWSPGQGDAFWAALGGIAYQVNA